MIAAAAERRGEESDSEEEDNVREWELAGGRGSERFEEEEGIALGENYGEEPEVSTGLFPYCLDTTMIEWTMTDPTHVQ